MVTAKPATGLGSTGSIPVVATGITSATEVSAGWGHTCATLAGGNGKCWGENSYGELGNGALSYRSIPASVVGLTPSIPTVTSITPSIGSWSGGTAVTITGTGFVTGSTSVTFGGVAGTSVAVVSPTQLTVSTPSLVHPYAIAQSADVTVTTPAGTTTRANGFTYRGVAMIMIRGLGSSYSPGQNDPFTAGSAGGLALTLVRNGMPAAAVLQFSYKGGSAPGGVWTPNAYACQDTYGPIAVAPTGSPDPPVVALDKMIRTYADSHRDVDVYLVGHSQGGVVAMAYAASVYAAYLRHSGDSPSAIRGATTANEVRLAGVITLDSPIGGVAGGGIDLQHLLCDAATGGNPLASSVLDFKKLWVTTVGQGTPLGGVAQTGKALLSDPSLGSNDTMTRAMQGDPEAPVFLTIGNTLDYAWVTSLPPSPDPLTTQWLTNALPSNKVYAGAITDSLSGTAWFADVLHGDLLALSNHERVKQSTDVAASVWQLLQGLPPAIAGAFPSFAVHAATSAASAATTPANAIIGTVTGAGGTPLVGLDVAAISTTSWAATAATTTAADGMYRLPVDPGTYLVVVHDPGGAHPAGYAGTSHFTTDVDAAQHVTVGVADVTVDIALVTAHTVGGTVTAAGGGPLAGVRVDAQDVGGTFVTGAVTAADGTYALTLADGTYKVHLNGAGVRASGYYATGGFVSTLAAGSAVTVAGSPLAGINIAMPLIAHLAGVVTGVASAPLANILVTASAVGGGADAVAYTAADGSYALAVEAGTYTVSFTDPTGRYASGYAGASGYVSGLGSARQLVVALADITGISVSLPGLPELTLSKTHTGDFTQGQVGATYTLTVTNGGAAATSAPVSVVDTLPAGLTATALSGPGWACVLATLTCTRADVLAAGASYPVITLTLNVVGGAPASVVNTATVAGGGETNTANNGASDLTTIVGLVPGAPTSVIATPGNASALVSWAAPASDGGSPITGYTATSAPGGKTCTTTGALSCTVTGLTNGTAYTFTVTATNVIGTGPASTATIAVTPALVPGAPTGVSAVAGYHQATVSWSVPASDGGSAILSYTVTSTPGSFTSTAIGPAATSAIVSGLSIGTSYTFTVHATNAVGDSLESTASNAVSPTGATYVALTPARLLDSRLGNGLSGTFSDGVPRTFQVTGRGGVPSNAVAVTGNLTVTNQTWSGYVFLGPNPTANPTSSTLNFPVGDNRANEVTVALGAGGTLSATYVAGMGTTDLVFDVTGYFVPDLTGATYVALTPRPPARQPARQRPVGHVQRWRPAHLPGDRPGRRAEQRRGGHRQPDGDEPDVVRLCLPGTEPHRQPDQLDAQLPGRRQPRQWGHRRPRLGRHPERDLCRGRGHDRPGLRRDRLLRARSERRHLRRPHPGPPARQPGRQRPVGHVQRMRPAHLPGDRPGRRAEQRGGGDRQPDGDERDVVRLCLPGTEPHRQPDQPTLNFPVGDNRANEVTVALGAGGTLSATYVAGMGTTDLVFDVTGYFVP